MSGTRGKMLLFLKGMAMGAADSVPGVSGGTVALVTNIYEELVDSIKCLGWQAVVVCRQQGVRQAWRYINGEFLLILVAGLFTSLLIFGHLVLGLMESYLPYLLAFFAGLVLVSIRFVAGHIQALKPLVVVMILLGVLLSAGMAFMPVRQSEISLPLYFIFGALAICAMILPGISGAFILVLLGAYAPVLQALVSVDIPVIITFAAGCLSGLMLFSRLLSWLLHHFHSATLGVLTGMLAGSLVMLWPWQLVRVQELADHSWNSYQAVSPAVYLAETGDSFSPLVCTILMISGGLLVLILEYLAGNLGHRQLPSSVKME